MPARITRTAHNVMRQKTTFQRVCSLLALVVLVFAAGCKQPTGGAAGLGTVKGVGDTVVQSVTQYADPSNSQYVYYVCKIVWTNRSSQDVTPRIAKFILTDADNVRYPALETGSTALIGVSNYHGIVKQGESHEYTVGYRVLTNVVGSIYYDPS